MLLKIYAVHSVGANSASLNWQNSRPDSQSPPLYVYCGGAIDDWTAWADLYAMAGTSDHEAFGISADALFLLLFSAVKLVLERGWGSPPRHGPRFAPVPDLVEGNRPQFMVGLKEDNNGVTWIISPVPLPHLAEYDVTGQAKPRE